MSEKMISNEVKDGAENCHESTIQKVEDNNQPLEDSTPKVSTDSAEGAIMNNENHNSTPETTHTPLPEGVTEEPRDETEPSKITTDIINDRVSGDPAMRHYMTGDITREPQSSDQLHLDTVEAVTSSLDVYMATTDDKGTLLGNPKLYNSLKEILNLPVNDDLENPLKALDNAIKITASFTESIILKDSTIEGIFTNYKIMVGESMNKIKEIFYLVRNDAPITLESTDNESSDVITRKTKWKPWIIKHSRTQKSYRYLQVCMQLAQAEDALNYAFLGQERLLNLIRVDKNIQIEANDKVTKPINIGNLIQDNEIVFDLSNDPNPTEDQIAQIDFISFHHRMNKMAQLYSFSYDDLDLNRDLVIEAIKTKPKPFTNSQLKELCIIKRTGGDTNVHLEAILNNDASRKHAPEINYDNGIKALKPILQQASDIFSYIAKPGTDIEIDAESLALVNKIIGTFQEIIKTAANSAPTTDSE